MRFSFFLHAHLPWVLTHGRWPHGAEWLCEAALETYIPLLDRLRRLGRRGVRGGVTLGVSPVLAEQLAAPAFRKIFREFLDERIRTSRDDEDRRTEFAQVARGWRQHYEHARAIFYDELQGDLLGAFRALEDEGVLEIATCGATHGYLPLLGRDESIALQIELACRVHERHFGRAPRGIWLPEAAYRPGGPWRARREGSDARWRPGVEEFLASAGIEYFIVDSSLLERGTAPVVPGSNWGAVARKPAPRSAPSAPSRDTRRSYWASRDFGREPSVAFFVRDPRTAVQVWSGDEGYPGDSVYLEFHKKSETGGHRYWRITGAQVDLGVKAVYDCPSAKERARAHAEHFRDLIASAAQDAPDDGIVTAPFDAELFGHWWFEGIDWLEHVLTLLHEDARVELTTLGRHVHAYPPTTATRLPEGSWGAGGGHDVWMNPQVSWSWDTIHRCEDLVFGLWSRARQSHDPWVRRAAIAAARQLLILSASDWQFLVTTGTAADYAVTRLRRHARDVERLVGIAEHALGTGVTPLEDRDFVDRTDSRDPLFPELETALDAAMYAGAPSLAGPRSPAARE